MASVTTSSSAPLVARASLVQTTRVGVSSSPILGLPLMAKKGKVRCSMENGNPKNQEINSRRKGTGGASLLAAAAAATLSSPAMALVDERIGTEGTGLPLGLDNNILGWIIVGVFGTIWALYFTWTTTLEEDEESGLSL